VTWSRYNCDLGGHICLRSTAKKNGVTLISTGFAWSRGPFHTVCKRPVLPRPRTATGKTRPTRLKTPGSIGARGHESERNHIGSITDLMTSARSRPGRTGCAIGKDFRTRSTPQMASPARSQLVAEIRQQYVSACSVTRTNAGALIYHSILRWRRPTGVGTSIPCSQADRGFAINKAPIEAFKALVVANRYPRDAGGCRFSIGSMRDVGKTPRARNNLNKTGKTQAEWTRYGRAPTRSSATEAVRHEPGTRHMPL